MATETLIFLLTFGLSLVYFLLPSFFIATRSGVTELAGNRDDMKPVGNVYEQRARRANANFQETLPWAIGLLILVQLTGGDNETSAMGAWVYFVCRCLYLPTYILGIPYLRSLIWAGSLIGLVMIALQVM